MEAEDQKGAPPKKKGASGGGGLDWQLERQYAYEREMLMATPGCLYGPFTHQKQRPFSADLLQNCDLPPPAKLFGPSVVGGAKNNNTPPFPNLQSGRLEDEQGTEQKVEENGNGSLLRALRLSQSRAREAEEKLAAAGASNEDLAVLLVRESMVLSAHRRWVMLLEAENSMLRGDVAEEEEKAIDTEAGHRWTAAWWVAVAVCGIAGVGLALGKFLF